MAASETAALPGPPQLAVVVPTFNEAGNVGLLYERVAAALDGVAWEMIVVDDNSPDGTADAVNALSRQYGNIRCLRRIGRRGLSSACIEGICATAAPLAAVMDADHQHDETVLPAMLAAAADADLVIASRFVGDASAAGGLSKRRLQASRAATRLSALVAGRQVSDPMSGYFLIRRSVFDAVAPRLSAEGFKILLDLMVTAGRAGVALRIAEIPYAFRPRHAGESKMSPLIGLQFLGLFVSKLSGGVLPASFLMFALVGATGIGVHLLLLSLLSGAAAPFLVAQALATLGAMTWNFFLNNTLTYPDRRLRGKRMWLGLAGFCLVCSLGAIANLSVASLLYQARQATLVAGLAGALMSSVFNYAVTRVVTWR